MRCGFAEMIIRPRTHFSDTLREHGIFDQLNWKIELSEKEGRFSLADAEWGRLPDGHVVAKPVPLFPRIEKEFLGNTRAARVAESVITIASFSRRKGRQLTLHEQRQEFNCVVNERHHMAYR